MIAACLAATANGVPASVAVAAESVVRLAAGPPPDQASKTGKAPELTPDQKMKARFPQPVRVGDLLGLPVLDDDDSTIGYVRQVVRSPEGKVYLIVPYSRWFGWARTDWGKRPVAVPIETVVILARQLDALDMSRDEFDDSPTWQQAEGKSVPEDEKTLIALGRR